jgi:hypothetical protein
VIILLSVARYLSFLELDFHLQATRSVTYKVLNQSKTNRMEGRLNLTVAEQNIMVVRNESDMDYRAQDHSGTVSSSFEYIVCDNGILTDNTARITLRLARLLP